LIDDLEFKYDSYGGHFYYFRETKLISLSNNIYFLLDSTGIKVCNESDLISCHDSFEYVGDDHVFSTLSYYYYSNVPYQNSDTTWTFQTTSYTRGNWYYVSKKFFSFKFSDKGKWFIGWIKAGFNSEGKLEIDAYGYREVIGCS
jgi:hypothetical protein